MKITHWFLFPTLGNGPSLTGTHIVAMWFLTKDGDL